MISQSQSHGRRALLIAMDSVRYPQWLAQSAMSPMEIVIEDLQTNEGIPRRIPFGKGVGLAGQGIEPITQRSIEPFQVRGSGSFDAASHRGSDLD